MEEAEKPEIHTKNDKYQIWLTSAPRIRSLEENGTEEQQRGLPSLPACDPHFPQPPISAVPKSSFDGECDSSHYSACDCLYLQVFLISVWCSLVYHKIQQSSNIIFLLQGTCSFSCWPSSASPMWLPRRRISSDTGGGPSSLRRVRPTEEEAAQPGMGAIVS